MTMNALDTALVQLASASTALEHHALTLKDVENAEKAAKAAADIIGSARKLMAFGVYTVCDEPAGAYVDPVEHKIEMPEVIHIELDESPAAPELLPMPDLFLAGFLESTPDEQKVAFESALEDLEQKGFEALPEVTSWEDAPWWEAFDADPARAWNLLQFGISHREPFSFDVPTDGEFAAWRAGFAPAPDPLPEPAPYCEICGQTAVHSEDCVFSGPVGEEVVGEPTAGPDIDPAAFAALLDEMEERGVESGQKRKNWKKANAAWQGAFAVAPGETFAKLQGLIDRGGCTWEIPEDEIKEEEAI